MQIYATLATDTAVRNLEESGNSYNCLHTFVRIKTMSNRCDFSKLCNSFHKCKHGETFIELQECNRDISGHLRACKVNLHENLTELQLLLARAGKLGNP